MNLDTETMLCMSLDDIKARRKEQLQPKPKATATTQGSGGHKVTNTQKRREQRLKQKAPYTVPAPHKAKKRAGHSLTHLPAAAPIPKIRTQKPAGPYRVRVSNLAFNTTLPYLLEGLERAGTVLRGEIAMDPQTGRSLGYGTADYLLEDDAVHAVEELSGQLLNGRPVYIEHITLKRNPPSTAKKGSAGATTSSSSTAAVYVGNLPFEARAFDLLGHMNAVGRVVKADIFQDSSGRSKGCGIVTYSHPSEAKVAVDMLHNSYLLGRPLFVRADREAEHKPSARQMSAAAAPAGVVLGPLASSKVYVGNLDYKVPLQALTEHMRRVGKVLDVDLFAGPNGRNRGCAIVEYADVRSAARAIRELHDTELDGRLMFVREDRDVGGHDRVPDATGRQIHVSNLSKDVQWPDLKDLCKTVGVVQFADIQEDQFGISRGSAIVRYETEGDARAAVKQLNGALLLGTRIHVREHVE